MQAQLEALLTTFGFSDEARAFLQVEGGITTFTSFYGIPLTQWQDPFMKDLRKHASAQDPAPVFPFGPS